MLKKDDPSKQMVYYQVCSKVLAHEMDSDGYL